MDSRTMRMDSEFDRQLVDMKPYLLNLPHKSEKQRCALWIKKLCEPIGSSTARKNRNVYAKLLLHMLKRGILEGPFATRPESGPLKTLPSYMSLFFDEPTTSYSQKELGAERTSDIDFKITTTPSWAHDELPHSSSERFPSLDENFSPLEQFQSSPLRTNRHDNDGLEATSERFINIQNDTEPRVPRYGSSDFRAEQTLIQRHEKELDVKTKLLEAEFHEEKLNLQHKHDLALQKVLNRKNNEIDELKHHYKVKEKEADETKRKLEKKLQTIIKESQVEKDNKEKQIENLTGMVEETGETLRAEYEAKIHDLMGDMEREKYELQKSHTKNIQELLDDTNRRLTSMEDEYNSQTQATKVMISELERHVSQLTQETETMAKSKQVLSMEKQQLEIENSRLATEARQAKNKCEELLKEAASLRDELTSQIRKMKTKHDADLEYIKQDQKVTAARAQEATRELENQVQNLKHALQDSEQLRSRDLREKESLHQQDVMSMTQLNDKQLHSLRTEWDHERSQQTKALKTLEDTIREKDEQIVKLTIAQKQCAAEAQQAIETYKKQVSDAQQKVYADMRGQLERMETDLEQSRLMRDRLQEEHGKQMEEMKEKHNEELNEHRVLLEHDRGTLTQRYSMDRDKLMKDYEAQLSMSESRLRDALEQQEKIAEERRSQHQEVVVGLEQQIRELREELVSVNALRRQQLVELGLLREEERQKATRDHDVAVSKLEAELDRQRMELHQQHANELERQTQKMKKRMEQMDEDYRQRLDRAHERMMEAQNKEASMRELMIQSKNEAEEQFVSNTARFEEDHNQLKVHHNAVVLNLQSELERNREEMRLKQRRFEQMEFDLKNELSRVKIECEERMKGLLPKSLKLDMEDTISCLRSQIKSLQQRVEVLQEEVDVNYTRCLTPRCDLALL